MLIEFSCPLDTRHTSMHCEYFIFDAANWKPAIYFRCPDSVKRRKIITAYEWKIEERNWKLGRYFVVSPNFLDTIQKFIYTR